MKLVGEKAIGPFIVELEKDNFKMSKVKECYEKATINVKVAAAKKDKSAPASSKSSSAVNLASDKTSNNAKAQKPVTKRPATCK